MKKDRFDRKRLNRSLVVFFKDALRVAIRNPSQALAFSRTILWLKKAARLRAHWNRKGITVPPIIIFSVTNQCNLRCKGCYAQALHGSGDEHLTTAEMRKIIEEAGELGVSFIVLAGGEPFVRQQILDITEDFPQMLFLVFTNGLLIDEMMMKRLKKQRNVVPLLSLEGPEKETDERRGRGVYKRLAEIMMELQAAGLFYGVSLMLSRPTFNTLTNPGFIQDLVDTACKFFLFVEYTPVEEETEHLTLDGGQRSQMMSLVKLFRSRWPALFISVPGDESEVGGCLSSGRGFVHISAKGELEPCPFAPFSDVNLKDMALKEALQSRLLSVLREHSEGLSDEEGGCILWKKREWVNSLIREKIGSGVVNSLGRRS
jgi:MoaA/NifB/PqqE/SkfB family radical SAM enzyme